VHPHEGRKLIACARSGSRAEQDSYSAILKLWGVPAPTEG